MREREPLIDDCCLLSITPSLSVIFAFLSLLCVFVQFIQQAWQAHSVLAITTLLLESSSLAQEDESASFHVLERLIQQMQKCQAKQ